MIPHANGCTENADSHALDMLNFNNCRCSMSWQVFLIDLRTILRLTSDMVAPEGVLVKASTS